MQNNTTMENQAKLYCGKLAFLNNPIVGVEDLQKAIQDNLVTIHSQEQVNTWNVAIQKAEHDYFSKSHADVRFSFEIEKAKKDFSRLAQRRVSVVRDGKTFMQTVYVKVVDDPKTGKQMEYDMKVGDTAATHINGELRRVTISSVKFNEKTDKYGTATVTWQDENDKKQTKSVSLDKIMKLDEDDMPAKADKVHGDNSQGKKGDKGALPDDVRMFKVGENTWYAKFIDSTHAEISNNPNKFTGASAVHVNQLEGKLRNDVRSWLRDMVVAKDKTTYEEAIGKTKKESKKPSAPPVDNAKYKEQLDKLSLPELRDYIKGLKQEMNKDLDKKGVERLMDNLRMANDTLAEKSKKELKTKVEKEVADAKAKYSQNKDEQSKVASIVSKINAAFQHGGTHVGINETGLFNEKGTAPFEMKMKEFGWDGKSDVSKVFHNLNMKQLTEVESIVNKVTNKGGSAVKTNVSIKSENYDWGRLVVLSRGNEYKAIMHPEHQEEFAKVASDPDVTTGSFTDEQGHKWNLKKLDDEGAVQLKSGNYTIKVSAKDANEISENVAASNATSGKGEQIKKAWSEDIEANKVLMLEKGYGADFGTLEYDFIPFKIKQDIEKGNLVKKKVPVKGGGQAYRWVDPNKEQGSVGGSPEDQLSNAKTLEEFKKITQKIDDEAQTPNVLDKILRKMGKKVGVDFDSEDDPEKAIFEAMKDSDGKSPKKEAKEHKQTHEELKKDAKDGKLDTTAKELGEKIDRDHDKEAKKEEESSYTPAKTGEEAISQMKEMTDDEQIAVLYGTLIGKDYFDNHDDDDFEGDMNKVKKFIKDNQVKVDSADWKDLDGQEEAVNKMQRLQKKGYVVMMPDSIDVEADFEYETGTERMGGDDNVWFVAMKPKSSSEPKKGEKGDGKQSDSKETSGKDKEDSNGKTEYTGEKPNKRALSKPLKDGKEKLAFLQKLDANSIHAIATAALYNMNDTEDNQAISDMMQDHGIESKEDAAALRNWAINNVTEAFEISGQDEAEVKEMKEGYKQEGMHYAHIRDEQGQETLLVFDDKAGSSASAMVDTSADKKKGAENK